MSGPQRVPVEDRADFVISEEGCFLWQGNTNKGGYGCIGVGKKTVLAHRAIYESTVGPIPDGLTLDHLCKVHPCVNVDHLEPVTQAVNVERGDSPSAINARKTHCIRGHEFTPENTYRWRGQRRCITCNAHPRAKKVAEHGTQLAYRRDRCRCPECKGWNARKAALRRRRLAQEEA